MPTTRPYAYNTGSTINGTTQSGSIAIGVSQMDYSSNPGGITWYMGPDENLGQKIFEQFYPDNDYRWGLFRIHLIYPEIS